MGLNSMGEGLQLTESKLLVQDVHVWRYREDQPELAIWFLLDCVDTLILRLGLL